MSVIMVVKVSKNRYVQMAIKNSKKDVSKTMANKKTRAVTLEEYKELISTIENGFLSYEPNPRVAMALRLEANLGIRIEDILSLRPVDIVWDYDRYRLDITEKKTGKKRTFVVAKKIVDYIKKYCAIHCIPKDMPIIPISERMVQRQLALAADYLGYENIGTHSFRKFFATALYRDTLDPVLVQNILQHASVETTRRYIGIENRQIEEALERHIVL